MPDIAIHTQIYTEVTPLVGKVDGWLTEEHTLRVV